MFRNLAAAAALLCATTVTSFAQTVDREDRQVPSATPNASSPLNSVCHLWTKRKVFLGIFTKRYTGSAVLYKGQYLITAGHNVYQDKSKLHSIEVRCGAVNARSIPAQQLIEGAASLDAALYEGSGWRGAMPYAHDYGVIRLNTPIEVANPFTLAKGVQAGEKVKFAGFPGGTKSDGWHMFQADAKLTGVANDLADYDLETFTSNSGGPVWREVDGKFELVAIHVKQGSGRVVNKEFRDEIERLIGELD